MSRLSHTLPRLFPATTDHKAVGNRASHFCPTQPISSVTPCSGVPRPWMTLSQSFTAVSLISPFLLLLPFADVRPAPWPEALSARSCSPPEPSQPFPNKSCTLLILSLLPQLTQLLRPQALETCVWRLLPSLPVVKDSQDIHAWQGRALRGQLAPFLLQSCGR